jgi:hypothetical protein
MEQSHRTGENPYQLHISQGTDTKIYRELKKLNSEKSNDPVKKWANELNRAFSKEESHGENHLK